MDDILALVSVDEDDNILTEEEILLLEELMNRPLDINRASRHQLANIPLIAPADVSLILSKRQILHRFTAIEQAATIPGLSLLASQLLPLVAVVKKRPPTKITLRNRWAISSAGARVLTRAAINRPLFSGGFTLERDPEEPSLDDFASAYMSADLGTRTRLTVGDHQVVAGYGLLFGRSARTSKGNESMTAIARLGTGLRPYTSASEYWALRGVAIKHTNSLGQWTISLSASPKDAALDSNRVTSIATSGVHNTKTSLARKHDVREEIAILSWQNAIGQIGDMGLVLARDRWTFKGSRIANRPSQNYGSVFGRIESHQLQCFGEIASYAGTQVSYVGGVVLTHENIRWLSSIRSYTAGFEAPRSQPFREWGGNDLNETGVYQAISIKLGNHRLFTYGDIYRESSAEAESGRPAQGFETAATWRYRWRGGQISLRWKREEKSQDGAIAYAGDTVKTGVIRAAWRLNSSLSLSRGVQMRFQGDRIAIADGDTTFWGHGLSAKLYLRSKQWRVSFNWVGFVADDYQSRIYVWDLNLPGEMRSRTFHPTGQSIALFIKTTTTTRATLSFRIRTTWQFSRYTGKWFKPSLEGGFQMDIAF